VSTNTRLERIPDGIRLTVSRRMALPAGTVWRAFRDTRVWPEWGPSLRAVDCEDRYIRAGSTGHVTTVGGIRLPATGHRVESADCGCVAAFEVPVPAAPYAVVCRSALRRLERVAAATDEE
jgi:hypothetical protein